MVIRKMCTSGRINFFWGVFSAFMVYALTLFQAAFKLLYATLCIPQSVIKQHKRIDCPIKKYYIYIYSIKENVRRECK